MLLISVDSPPIAIDDVRPDHWPEIVGRRNRLGELRGVWRDVMPLERRSDLVS